VIGAAFLQPAVPWPVGARDRGAACQALLAALRPRACRGEPVSAVRCRRYPVSSRRAWARRGRWAGTGHRTGRLRCAWASLGV
jgi:hypothetical protein